MLLMMMMILFFPPGIEESAVEFVQLEKRRGRGRGRGHFTSNAGFNQSN